MSEQNKKVAIDYIEAMGRGDAAAALACMAKDVKVVSKGFGKVSGARTYDEAVGFLGLCKQLMPTGLQPKFLTVTAEGNRVAVELEGNAVLCTGTPYCNQYVMMFTLEDGKIKQMNEYLCTNLADEALMPAVESLLAAGQNK